MYLVVSQGTLHQLVAIKIHLWWIPTWTPSKRLIRQCLLGLWISQHKITSQHLKKAVIQLQDQYLLNRQKSEQVPSRICLAVYSDWFVWPPRLTLKRSKNKSNDLSGNKKTKNLNSSKLRCINKIQARTIKMWISNSTIVTSMTKCRSFIET